MKNIEKRRRANKRRCTWYMEPFDPQTNKVIAAILPAEDALHSIAIGKTVHNVWRCEHRAVQRLLAAAPQLDLRFAIFCKEGNHGRIRPWKFERAKRAPSKRVAA